MKWNNNQIIFDEANISKWGGFIIYDINIKKLNINEPKESTYRNWLVSINYVPWELIIVEVENVQK